MRQAELSTYDAPAQRVQSSASTVGAIVIGGDYRGLGVVRSLGRKGIPVWVMRDENSMAAFSRFTRRSLRWPTGSEEQRVDFLLSLAEARGLDGWGIFPTTDATAAILSRNHARLSTRYVLTVPPWETLKRAYDKRLLHELPPELGIDQPTTYYLDAGQDIATLDIRFPAILKPAVKEELGFNPLYHDKAWRVESRDQLLASFREACELVERDTLLVQELLPPGAMDYSVGAICSEGRVLASVTTWRPRQYPIDFGRASTYVETIELPAIEEPARRFIEHIRYTGIVEVAFRLDPRDGKYKLLDVNPRAWGWHIIARRAGLDFPYLLWRLAHGESVPEMKAPAGLRWRRAAADVVASVQLYRRGLLTVREFLRTLGGPTEFAGFALDDPLPVLAEYPLMLSRAFMRTRARSKLATASPQLDPSPQSPGSRRPG